MTAPFPVRAPVAEEDNQVSALAFGSMLLRWRRTVIALGLAGAVLGLAKGLTSTRLYTSTATFIPQGSEGGISGVAFEASKFGIRVPSSGGTWGPPVYVELLRSRAVLEPIARDSLVVTERGGARVSLTDLLELKASTPTQRTDVTVRALRRLVTASEKKSLGAVTLSVTTPWPSVSLALAERLVSGVNQFNLLTRKSQAGAERQFVETQAGVAERTLRAAEDRFQLFLQRNRVAGSPELEFERDRLQRDVTLRQSVYSLLLQNKEEARIREVRDTPVITVLEDPRLPVVSEARNSVQQGVLGGIAGVLIGVLAALLAQGLSSARRAPNEEALEFFRLVEDATPKFLRRASR